MTELPWLTQFFAQLDGAVPAIAFFDAVPTTVVAEFEAILDAVAEAPLLSPVRHHRCLVGVVELVHVPEPLERSLDLFVNEPVRAVELSHSARHRARNPEMLRPPGHVLTEADQTAGDPATARSPDSDIDARCVYRNC